MKRLTMILTAALAAIVFSAGGASAQEDFSRKPVISAGWGGYPYLDYTLLWDRYRPDYRDQGDLQNIYLKSYGTKRITSVMALSCDFPVKSWLSIPVVTSVDLGWRPCMDYAVDRKGTEFTADLKIMSGARFNYYRRQYFGIYSAVFAGLDIVIDGPSSANLLPALQLVPFGMRFGGRLFGYAECGVGTMYAGGMAGIGYRF